MKELKHQFRWRSQAGQFHLPSQMETRHLWFTLRMIWNHSAPAHARFTPYKRYKFGPFYTVEYMRDAVSCLLDELLTRTNMESKWKQELKQMLDYTQKKLPQ